MRKNQLMIAAAVAALVAGGGLAMGQGAPSSAPAEKSAPAASEKSGGGMQMKQWNEKKGLNAPAKGVERRGSETTGQAPAQPGGSIKLGDDQKGPKDLKGQKDQKAGQANDKMNKNSQAPRGRNETTGQAPRDSGSGSAQREREPGTQQQNQMGREPSAQSPKRGDSNQSKSGTSSSTTSTTNVNVNLSSEQKTRIHEVIVKDRSAPRVANVNFSLSVGTTVPRSMKLARLPSTIIEIQPAWNGYDYFLVGDQIVVVDPRTLRIVAIIDV